MFRNGSFLEDAYLPAEAFRLSLTAEGLAAFQKAEEAALADFLAAAVPEMQVLGLRVAWSNTLPTDGFGSTDLKEPPIAVDVNLVAQYIRVESIPSLLGAYTGPATHATDAGHDAYVKRLKERSGQPLAQRDFLAAAAYTQLLNLTMQPGWSLDLDLRVPRGYEFTYATGGARQTSDRTLHLHVDALTENAAEQDVLLASITQPRAVATALFAALWVVGLAVASPLRFLYARFRMGRFRP